MDATLQIKIKALVEGLQDIANLGQKLLEVGDDSKALGEASKNLGTLGKTAKEAGRDLNDAFTGSAAKNSADIKKQIDDIKASLDRVKSSGASFEEVARATAIAEAKIAQLNAQLNPRAPKTYADTVNEAFNALGGRSTSKIQEEIAKVNAALQSVKDSGAGFEEVARATSLAEARIESLNREMANPAPKTLVETLSSVGNRLRTLDFKGIGDDLKQLNLGVSQLPGLLTSAVAGFVALKAANALKELAGDMVAFLKEAAQASAKVETLSTVLNVVGRNAGYSEDALKKAAKQVESVGITAAAARESLTQMIQSGININELTDTYGKLNGEVVQFTKAQELARAAQDLAVISGETSSETLQRLIVNMQQMDVQGLKFQGIIVNQEAAQAKLASSLGKTADALTLTEKRMAFQAATMEELRKLSGAYAESMETVGKKLGSLARFQEQFSVSIGNALVPAFGALVDAATEFFARGEKIILSMTEQSTVAKDLKDGLAPLVGMVKDLGLTLLTISFDVFKGAAGVFSEVGKAVGTVWQLVKDLYSTITTVGSSIVRAFSDSDESAQRFMRALDPIQGLFTGIRLAVAAVSDGITVLVAAAEVVGAAFLDVFGDIEIAVGKLVGFFNQDLGDALVKAGQGYKKAAAELEGSAEKLFNKMADGQGALSGVVKGLEDSSTAASNTSQSYRDAAAEIDKLAAAQRSGATSAQELTEKTGQISTAMLEQRLAGQLSAEEFGKLSKQLQAVPNEITKAFSEASTAAKIDLGNLRSNITADVGTGISMFQQFLQVAATGSDNALKAIGSSAKTVGQDVLNVYSTLVDRAKSVQDLKVINEQLNQAFKDNIITQDQFSDALKRSTLKFDELFNASLKAARTSGDFDNLSTQVKELGEKGAISGTKVKDALDKIKTAAEGLQGVYKELQAAQDRLVIADQRAAVFQARLEVAKQEAEVNKANLEVIKAQFKYAQDGTELSRVEVEIAKTQLEIEKVTLEQVRLGYKEQQASMDVLIAKQQILNAERKLGIDATDEQAQRDLAQAKQLEAIAETQVIQYKEQRDATVEQSVKLQEQGLILSQKRDILQTLKDLEDQRKASIQGSNGALQEQKGHVDNVAGAFGGVLRAQDAVGTGYQSLLGASASWSKQATEDYLKVKASIDGLLAAQQNLDVASGTRLVSGNNAGSTGTSAGSSTSSGSGTSSGSNGTSSGSGTNNSSGMPVNSTFVGGMVLDTWLSIYNQLKGYGLPDAVAREIAEEFAPNGVIKYENNPAQMKYAPGGGSMSLAIRNAAQKWLYDHPNGGDGGLAGSRGGLLGTGATGGLGGSVSPSSSGYDGTGSKAGQSLFGSAAYANFKPSDAVVTSSAQSIAQPSAKVSTASVDKVIKVQLESGGKTTELTAPASEEAKISAMFDALGVSRKRA